MAYGVVTGPTARRPRRKPAPAMPVGPGRSIGASPVRPNRPRNYAPATPSVGPTPWRPAPAIPPQPRPLPTGPPPLSSQGSTLRANAEQMRTGGQGAYRDSVYRAAMALGDPEVLNQLKADPAFQGYSFVQDPTSQYSQLGRQETEGLQTLNYNANDRGALNSGFLLTDRGKYSQGINDQRMGAYHDYQDLIGEAARILAGVMADARGTDAQATQADIDAADAIDPTDQTSPDAPAPRPTAPAAPRLPRATGSKSQKTTKKKPKNRFDSRR
jgi:hypothetical protein